MREVAAEFERPVLLFSGGKDSIVLLRLAEKAFRPARVPFPIMHVDTGHNFPEVVAFGDRRVGELDVWRCIHAERLEVRAENSRRAGEAARMLADAGIVALVSPYAEHRERVKRRHEDDGLPFVEIYVDTPLEVCEERDPKGLYRRARAGTLRNLTGIDDPYEAPSAPAAALEDSVAALEALLRERGVA